jgi:hypothetical protein
VRQLQREKEQRKTALRAPAPPRTAASDSGAGGDASEGGGARDADERPPTAEEAAAQKAAAEASCKALQQATSEFQGVRSQMEAVAAQRQRLLEGAKDIAWALKRLDPRDTLQQGDDPQELKRALKAADARAVAAAEAARRDAAAHAAALQRERDGARAAQARATKAEVGQRAAVEAAKAGGGGGGGGGASSGGGWGWSGAASTRALLAAKGSREQMAAMEELAASRGALLAEYGVRVRVSPNPSPNPHPNPNPNPIPIPYPNQVRCSPSAVWPRRRRARRWR